MIATLQRREHSESPLGSPPCSESLFVVPCSATKSRILQDGTPLPARDAYTGQSFRMARHRLEKAGAKWCILSGYYGFIWPSTVIENYDVKMEPVNDSTVWDECFGSITNRQYARLMTAERIVVLGSKLYANAAAVLLRRKVEAPLVGLPIGKMLQRLADGDLFSLPNAESIREDRSASFVEDRTLASCRARAVATAESRPIVVPQMAIQLTHT